MSARRRKRAKVRGPSYSHYLSFTQRILNQKDMLKMILSFLTEDALKPRVRFDSPIFNASSFIRENLDNESLVFTVLPVSLKRINKFFNDCITELSHLIICKQRSPNIVDLSHCPGHRHLKQLYLIQDLSKLNAQQIQHRIDALTEFNLPCLEILQIHYYHINATPMDIVLNMEMLPSLQTLILGVLYDNPMQPMTINRLELDLDITEFRMHYCNLYNLDSLRYSLAKCSMIHALCLGFKPRFVDYEAQRKDLLHALCLLSVHIMFVQIDFLHELSVYAPNLRLVQFHQCDNMDKLILLDRMPPSLISRITPLQQRSENENKMDVDGEEEGEEDEEEGKEERVLEIAFNAPLHALLTRHMPKFTVLRNAKRYNEECNIEFTMTARDCSIWPFAFYEYVGFV